MRLVDELVPNRKVRVNTQEKIRHDDKRHDFHRFPITRIVEQQNFEHVGEHDYRKQNERSKNHEILGDDGVGLFGVVVSGMAKKER